MIDLRHLQTFCAVTEANSFTLAAIRLGCSQPTVSTHIQLLESELGARLFKRSRFTRDVALTETGEQTLIYSRKLLRLAQRAPSMIRRRASQESKS
ncbi:MAG: LysR family transcriptional regulator [Acidobacteriota bacterium]